MKKQTKGIWTHEEEHALLSEFFGGKTMAQLAREAGITAPNIRNKIYDLCGDILNTGRKRYLAAFEPHCKAYTNLLATHPRVSAKVIQKELSVRGIGVIRVEKKETAEQRAEETPDSVGARPEERPDGQAPAERHGQGADEAGAVMEPLCLGLDIVEDPAVAPGTIVFNSPNGKVFTCMSGDHMSFKDDERSTEVTYKCRIPPASSAPENTTDASISDRIRELEDVARCRAEVAEITVGEIADLRNKKGRAEGDLKRITQAVEYAETLLTSLSDEYDIEELTDISCLLSHAATRFGRKRDD